MTDIRQSFESGSGAFAAWRLPYADSVSFRVSDSLKKTTELNSLTEVFLLCPFESSASECYFIGDAEGEAVELSEPFREVFNGRAEFTSMVQDAVKAINRKEMEKVVLSRKKKIELKKDADLFEIFLALEKAFPSAFVSLIRVKGLGTWLGASPELLLSVKNGLANSYALAGTSYPGSQTLGQKEEREQSIVSDYVRDAFQSAGLTDINRIDSLAQSGHLTHFLSRYSASIKEEQIPALVQNLHPTPAVCGLPKEAAMAHIRKSEKEERGLYSGFFGPYRCDSETQLYVNLRCMQWRNGEALLFGGCGITEASDAAAEWKETEEKINVLGKMLLPYC